MKYLVEDCDVKAKTPAFTRVQPGDIETDRSGRVFRIVRLDGPALYQAGAWVMPTVRVALGRDDIYDDELEALQELARRQREAMVALKRAKADLQLAMSVTAGEIFHIKKGDRNG